MKKTYAVYGKIEYVIAVNVGGQTCMADFSGGSLNNRGVIPAVYKTNNPIMHRAIESCNEFKNGIVRLLREEPEACDLVPKKGRPCKAKADVNTEMPIESITEETGLEPKVFTDYGSAREWLKSEYGVEAQQLGNQKKIREAAKMYGYEVVIEE